MPGDPARFQALSDVGHRDEREFVRPAACAACALGGKCHGIRRSYAALHGTTELRPVPPRP